VEKDQYCFKEGYEPESLLVPPLNSVPREIGVLFGKAFIDGRDRPKKRPDPSEWIKALSRYRKELKQCSNNDSHYYFRKLPNCVWCEADRRHKEKKPWSTSWPEPSKASGKQITWNQS
jgi:DNA-binding helix-hairpin-helix protein with protein kinase domain